MTGGDQRSRRLMPADRRARRGCRAAAQGSRRAHGAGAILALMLLLLPGLASARGIIIPVPDEDAPTGAPRPASPPPEPPPPSVDQGAAAPAASAPADRLCDHDQCRRGVVWHVTNVSDRTCLDLSTSDLASGGDLARLKTLLPGATFAIAQGRCAR